MKVTSVTDFRANIKRYLDCVIQDSNSVVINRGSTGAVLISLDEYNAIKNTESILASSSLDAAVRRGLEEIGRGDYQEVDIDSL